MSVALDKLLRLVVDKQATGLELLTGEPPGIRLRGDLRPLNLPPLTSEDTLRFMRALASAQHQSEFVEKGSCEFGLPFEGNAHFLVQVFKWKGHCGIRLRLVPRKPREVDNPDA